MSARLKLFFALSVFPFILDAHGPNYGPGVKVPALQQQLLRFTENKGQVRDQHFNARPDVLFSGSTQGMSYHLRNNGISYQLSRMQKPEATYTNSEQTVAIQKTANKLPVLATIFRVDMTWLNMNHDAAVLTDAALPGFDNYYLQGCPGDGVREVMSYSGVTYKNIYNGIDLHYYEKNGHLKYDYLVGPHADYKKIQIQVEGADKIELQADGSALIKTALGDITEERPLVYQNNKLLKAQWVLKSNILSFEVAQYNAALPMLIDPGVRVWGTYYGGAYNDCNSFYLFPYYLGSAITGCCTDASGNVYLAGETSGSSNEIATTGSHQDTYVNAFDAYLAKFNANGQRLWATYYGGAGNETIGSCATDALGNVYLAGSTDVVFPNLVSDGATIATPGSHQGTFGGGGYFSDAFLVKFNANGTRLWGTYYGGTFSDYGWGCATDINNNVYLCGYTGSTVGIATGGSYQSTLAGAGSCWNAFLVKFSATGVRSWGTYYGSTAPYWGTSGRSCATDASGNVYLCGETDSNTGTSIATAGGHQNTFGGGAYDAFLVKFNNNGVRQWGTFYGDSVVDKALSCCVDVYNNVYMCGHTTSAGGTAIATPGSHQDTSSGYNDAFLVKFNTTGVRQWGTYFGDWYNDLGYSCATDAAGHVYLAGYSEISLPGSLATPGSFQSSGNGGSEGFLAEFNGSGTRQWSTYYGGNDNDCIFSCCTHPGGSIYISGGTASSSGTFVASSGSHQSAYGGGTNDAFLARFFNCNNPIAPINNTPIANLSVCAGGQATLNMLGPGTVSWHLAATGGATLNSGNNYVTPALSPGTYTYYAEATTCASSLSRTAVTITVYALPLVTANSGTICSGKPFTIVAGGASSYYYSPGGLATVYPAITTVYTVTGTDANGCQNTALSNIAVNASPSVSAVSSNPFICAGETATLSVSGADTYTWSTGSGTNSVDVSPATSTAYTVTGANTNGCMGAAVVVQNVSDCTALVQSNSGKAPYLIYPNPNTGCFTLLSPGEAEVKIINALGQVILNEKMPPGTNQIDLSTKAKGIYLIKIKHGYGIENLKIIIQ